MASSAAAACQPSGSRPALVSVNEPVRALLKETIRSLQKRKSRSAPVYIEAYSSLKACPMQFARVRDLRCLMGFGPTIVNDLEKQLVDWCERNGMSYIASDRGSPKSSNVGDDDDDDGSNETDSDLESNSDREASVVRKIRRIAPMRSTGERTANGQTTENQQKSTRAKKAKPAKIPKAYVPQHRTGTHGILVALFTLTPQQSAKEDQTEASTDAGVEYYSKATIIHFAQPYSDSKYAVKQSAPSNGFGSSFHSAWTGMKTLINRGYVYRRGNPARFGLSHEGWAIAQICIEREKGLSAGCNVDRLSSVPTASTSKENGTKDKESKAKRAKENSEENQDARPFLYTYLTDADPPKQTNLRSEASARLSDGDYRMMYRITFPKELSDHAFVKSCVRGVGQEGSALCGWVKETACNEVAPGYPTKDSVNADSVACELDNNTSTRKPKETAKSEPRIPLQVVKSNKNNQQPTRSKNVKQSKPTPMQMDIIELLTSSDVEPDERCVPRTLDVGETATRAKANANRHDLDNDGDSDSSVLSDLIPKKKSSIVRKRKVAKVV